ncbi:hypothetical protein BDR26DRAFT_464041 [Obelidium mucronatum]|nr:hypothetical protein BDR26DRAFT_464041 [Obelidium mucronatum]
MIPPPPNNSPALTCTELFETLHKLLQWQPILNTTSQVRHVNNQIFQDQLTNLQIQLNLIKGYQNTISLGPNVITLPECAGCLAAAKSESQAEWGRHVMCEHDLVCPFVSLKNGDRCGCLFKLDSNISNVGQHMMRHYLVPVHHCKCGETFKTIYELKKHQKTHQNNARHNNNSSMDSVGLEDSKQQVQRKRSRNENNHVGGGGVMSERNLERISSSESACHLLGEGFDFEAFLNSVATVNHHGSGGGLSVSDNETVKE